MRRKTLMMAVALATGSTMLAVAPAWAQSGKGNQTGKGSPSSQFDVTTTNDTVDANPGDGDCDDSSGECSLRAAIQEANATPGDDDIRLTNGATYSLEIVSAGDDGPASGDLDVTSTITIEGRGATVDLDGFGDRAFDVSASGDLTVENLDVTGGTVPSGQSGGAFQSAGALRIFDARLSGNVAEGPMSSGGAIFNNAGFLLVADSTLDGNRATRAGGAIEANAGTTRLDKVRMMDNETGPMPGNGGGLHLTGAGTVEVLGSEISGNRASAEGGGLWNSATGTMTVTKTDLRDNVASGPAADQGGGGLFNDGGQLTVRTSRIEGNSADGAAGSGGGILNDGGTLSVSSSTIADNTAMRAGGGVEADIGSTNLDRVILRDNQTGPTPGNGGGLHVTGAGTVNVTRSDVSGNKASAEGGGLWNSAVGTMTVTDSQFRGNTASGPAADQGGGALFNDGGSLTVEDSSIRDNDADGTSGSGGGILNNTGELSVTSTLISGNSATRAGGGIEAVAGTTTLQHVTLKGNDTGPNPGNGGGLHLTGMGTVDIDNSSVTGNRAASEGGGLWNSATGTMIVTNTEVTGNQAPVGPNVFNDGGTFTLNGSPVAATPTP